ncbi:Methyltransferase FkbM domain protein [uncultured archaeon]|nr:Methyltransferase FkbM domain protein [uncultured archaeon]
MLKKLYHKITGKLDASININLGYLKYYRIKKGDIIVDSGAYLGYFTVFAAKKVGDSGKVIAFEPDPVNFEILKKKTASLKNVVLIKKALFNKETEQHWNSSFAKSAFGKEGYIVNCSTLDKELEKLGIKHVDFLKMDIEGAELEAIEGAKETLKNTDNLAIACYHKRDGKTTGELLQPVLGKMGFDTKIGFFLHKTLYGRKSGKLPFGN